MNGKRTLCIAIGLATAPVALPALADVQEQQPAPGAQAPAHAGLTELTDEEMGDMRGRYTVDQNTVAWFGVTMVSTWQNEAGQQQRWYHAGNHTSRWFKPACSSNRRLR